MTTLTTNPSDPITADGEYSSTNSYQPGSELLVEVTGDRAGGNVQLGLVDVDGNFSPATPPTENVGDISIWRIQAGYTGQVAVKVVGSATPSLRVAITQVRNFG